MAVNETRSDISSACAVALTLNFSVTRIVRTKFMLISYLVCDNFITEAKTDQGRHQCVEFVLILVLKKKNPNYL